MTEKPPNTMGIMYPSGIDVHDELSVSLPKARRWDGILSRECRARKPSVMQSLHEVLRNPDILSLGPGVAPRDLYPFYNLSLQARGWSASENVRLEARKCEPDIDGNIYGTRDVLYYYDDLKSTAEVLTEPVDLGIALDYGLATGASQLLGIIKDIVKIYHDPPYADWKCVLTTGNTSALDLSLRMFTERGDNIIVEEYTYPALMETASPLGVKCVPAKMDEYTLRPDALDELLRSWDEAKWGKRPRVIYLVPTGQNPSGATASLSRRREIYAVVQKWDLYILEDDPYYFIQFEPSLRTKTSGDRQCSPQELATALTPSYLSMDIDGRVLRMDTFSKVIAPGLRMGWVTASEQVVERLVRAQETSVQNPSGLSQLVTYRLFKNWSDIGFMNWILDIQSVYLTKRGVLATLIAKHLPPEIISYDLPKAGFFFWLKVDFNRHPCAHYMTPRQIEQAIYDQAIQQGALVIPGSWFKPNREIENNPEVFFRLSFAPPSTPEMEQVIRRLGVALRICFNLD